FETALQLRRALEGWLSTSGPQVSAGQIALLLHERCREDIELRAAGIMSLLPPPPPASSRAARSDRGPAHPDVPPGPAPTGDSGAGAMEIDRRSQRQEREGMSLVSGVAAVLVGLVLGLAVLSYVRTARKERAASAIASV